MTEFVVGGEREIFTNFAVGIKGIYRDYGNVIEDFLCLNDGTYCIGNPGKGGAGQSASGYFPGFTQIFTLDYSHTFPAPRPVRIYRGSPARRDEALLQQLAGHRLLHLLEARRQLRRRVLALHADHVGRSEHLRRLRLLRFLHERRDLTRITNRGPLSNDRRHQFKVSGRVLHPCKLSIGLAAYYRSGTPLTRYGYSDAYGRYEFFLTDRGAEGRTPDNYEADLHLGYPLSIGPVTVNFLFDVFNILNAQRPVLLDQRWGFQESDNASPTPVNPNYKKAVFRTPPTSARLGARVSF